MWQFVRSRLLLVITLVSATHGLLVVGPKYIRSNQNYTLVLTNFNSSLGRVDLKVKIDGTTDGGETILGLTKTVDVRRYQNRLVNFELPNLVPGNYKITLDGQRGFSFHKEADLILKTKSVSGLIQLDKPVFKPGDTVNFRVIVLDTNLKPPANVKTVNVTIQDPRGNVIRKWSAGRLHLGVFENKLEIAPTPLMGKFKMSVKIGGEELMTKSFEVKEYVLSTYEIDVYPTKVPLEEDQSLDLTVEAKYFTGKPVQGTAILRLYLSDGILDQTKTWEVYGMGQAQLKFNGLLDFYEPQHDVNINFTFIEKYTNRTLTIYKPITVHKYQYYVELVKDSPAFRPGMPYKCDIHVKYHNGTPAANVETEVTIYGLNDEYIETLTSDKNGVIKQTLIPSADSNTINIEVKIEDNDLLTEDIHRVETNTDAYVKIELKSKIMLNKPIKYSITCTDKMQFLVYYVVSKGNIIDEGLLRPSKTHKVPLQINANSKMIPKSRVIVATLAKDTIVYDTMDIEFKELSNNFKMVIDEQDREVKPGGQIELIMQGRPRSYVALAAYDNSLLQHNGNHDVHWENIEAVFDDFHDVQNNEYDKIHSMGLFARTLDSLQLEGASDKLARLESNGSSTKLIPFRTNFVESFLWKNLTIPINGQHKLIENVPESTTAWSLTGFSIDPEYGLGIIKQPIEFITVQSFYIVDNLPYSIKRGEAVALQFTLFNNLGGEYIADVTMYNVGNQTEFVGQTAGVPSYTKSISVKPKVGVPISFLVKPRKLGEMAVRLKASIMLGQETDAIEKVIRVLPESLVEKKMQSRIFSQNTYMNVSFPISLDIDKNADAGSQHISFHVNPNILTTVVQNLGDLLAVPTGCGEQNMVKFVPNIIALDYLTAIDSKDTNLINRATSLLRTGYQNQMRYRQTDGSFGVWQSGGGSVFLTAFVAKSMQTASKYISEVDVTMVAGAFQWLANKQQSTGRFNEVGPIAHTDMQGGLRNGIALTSYVLIAFLENENAKLTHQNVIARGVQYVAGLLPQVNDLYDLSIATYAMWLSGHHSKEYFINRLIDRSTVSDNGGMRYWYRDSNIIETTGYALLAMVQAGKFPDGVPVMRWLVNQRYVTGSFPRTQDTFVGLKALTKLAEVISPSRNDYSIQLKYKTQTKNFRVTSQEIGKLQFEDIPSDVKKIDINVAGLGFGLLDVKYEYALDLRNYTNRFVLTFEKLNTNSDYELKLKICASFIPKLANERSNMALVEVNFPSGYVVDPRPITEATTVNPIRNTEIRFGGTSVVAYYDNMGTEKNCFHITAYRRFKVALKRPAYVLVHDYYNPKLNAIQVYDVDQEKLCDICDKEDCPPECNK
ncbi:thioester-containing protein 1 allele S3-like [Anopheles ziemanni]|uniref:thioester-containing protein 1 allele S3-like n=1 Tax=Anopheles coustani TaxID=139045 RepID=UPI002659D2B5|nr:thioester-containing protein 1 allele S3-like [Anopheles coustani]XP_058173013.1 thioester-containing protein 1 allele S3-like [Anopheles ziemanni]